MDRFSSVRPNPIGRLIGICHASEVWIKYLRILGCGIMNKKRLLSAARIGFLFAVCRFFGSTF
jgi:hypothetical protein